MEARTYVTFSELFDRRPVMHELVELIKKIPLRHAVLVISRLNMAVRFVMEEGSGEDFAKVQKRLIEDHLDDDIHALLRERLRTARLEDRPIFLPQCLLSILRLVLVQCDPVPQPTLEEDEFVRLSIGRACLIMNDLLITTEEEGKLVNGSDDERRIGLMVQAMSGFEVANSPRAEHLIRRLKIMYLLVLQNPQVKARIAQLHQGFDFENTFLELVGITLERWLYVIFMIYAYFLDGANEFGRNPAHMVLSPSTFCGESGITQETLEIVLSTISMTTSKLKETIESEKLTDPRYDFVSFRSFPLLIAQADRLLPLDIAFIVDKCHAGVQWTMHDRIQTWKGRQTLFNAWGDLFQEYVHWLLGGMKTNLPVKYIPSPNYENDSAHETFDGILLQDGDFVALEYKGGFLSRTARYSGDSKTFLGELDGKFADGCDQLADHLGAVFCDNSDTRKRIAGFTSDQTESVRSIVPVLVLQDHIFRVPFLNWYLNKRFERSVGKYTLRPGLNICPLTVVPIQELESMVYAAEGNDFDFIHALKNRTVIDKKVLSDLLDWLLSCDGFKGGTSSRVERALAELNVKILEYVFPSSGLRQFD